MAWQIDYMQQRMLHFIREEHVEGGALGVTKLIGTFGKAVIELAKAETSLVRKSAVDWR